jgi:DNA-binding CsgD family transcriptional regulator
VSPLWQFFRSIFQNAPEAIAMLDATLRVGVWNKAAVALTGRSTSETLGRHCAIEGRRIVLDPAADGQGAGARLPRARLATSCEFQVGTDGAAPPPWPATVIPLQYDGIVLLMLSHPAVSEIPAARAGGPRAGAAPRRSARPGRASRPPGSGLRRLTGREQEILKLLAAGKTAKAIASELSLSLPTVRSHTQHILRKLGVHSSLEAVVWFLRSRSGGSNGADAD